MYNNPEDAEDFAVIKDSYRDVQRRFQEADLLRHIHSDDNLPDVVRNFPGVVRVLDSGPVRGHNDTLIATARPAASGVTRREKDRVVMGSGGSRLEDAKSVKDVLKAVFDGVEGTHHLSDLLDAVS